MRTALLAIAVVVFFFRSAPVAADPAAQAAEHVAAGKRYFSEQKYLEAAAEFRAAQDLQPDPKLLYSLAQAQRLAGDCAGAVQSYEAFIATKADPKLVEFSKENITRCKELLAKEPKPPVEKPVDPEPAQAPVAPPPEAAPPLAEPPPRRDTQRGGRPWYADVVGDVMLGAGLAATAGGAVVWLNGRTAASAANDATDYATFIEKRDAASSAVTKQVIGIGVGVAGVALAVGGIIHYKLSATSRAEVRVTTAPHGAGVAARIRF